MRAIDADAVVELLEPFADAFTNTEVLSAYLDTLQLISNAPTIDIVHCRECKRWWGNHWHDNEDGKCPMDAWIDGDGYCSYGEREDE